MLNSLFNRPPYKLGIALSGGGARGFAHAGALMALEQAGLRPDILAGVSAGSVVAAMYASGMHPRKILECFSGLKFSDLTDFRLSDLAGFKHNCSGLFKLSPFREFLRKTIAVKRLEELPIPTVVGVTNFDSGKAEAFSEGPLDMIVTASCSIPIVFQPTEINGASYVDGGLLHNLPAWAIRDKCRKLIGINCSPLRRRDLTRNGMVDTALRSYNLVAKSNANPDLAMCDLAINIDKIADYTVFDLSDTEMVFSAGYDAALKALRDNPDFNQSFFS